MLDKGWRPRLSIHKQQKKMDFIEEITSPKPQKKNKNKKEII